MRCFIVCYGFSLVSFAFADVAPTRRGTFRVEQACEEGPDDSMNVCRVCLVALHGPARRVQLADPDHEYVLYQSDIYVSPDERYILRQRKVCTGADAVYLYERGGELDYRLATHYDVGAAALQLFARQVGSEDGEDGIVDFVAWSRDGKSIVVSVRGRNVGGYEVLGWHCTFDIASGRGYVTPAQADRNTGTFKRASPR